MNNIELIADFINYAKSRHVIPIEQNIESLVDDYFSRKNDRKPIAIRSKCNYHAVFTFRIKYGKSYCSICGKPV